MKTFTIEYETNNITLHRSESAAKAVPDSERFSSEAILAKLASTWPASRLVEIWNSLPGETPVKKFQDKETGAARIWKAIQQLGEDVPVTTESDPITEVVSDERPDAQPLAAGPVAEPEGGEIAQPETAISEATEAGVTPLVAPQTPHVAPEGGPQRTRPPAQGRRPWRRKAKILAHPGKAAKPAR